MSSHVNPDGPLPLDPDYKKRLFTSNMEKKLVDVNPLKWRPLVMQHLPKGYGPGRHFDIFTYTSWLRARFGPASLKGLCRPQFLILGFVHWSVITYTWRYMGFGKYKYNSEFH